MRTYVRIAQCLFINVNVKLAQLGFDWHVPSFQTIKALSYASTN